MYKCVKGHFTDKEHDGKNCPYDNMSASELSSALVIDVPINELPAFNKVREVGKQYELSDKEVHAIHKYVNSFNDDWYKRINQALRSGVPISKQDEQVCKHLDSALDKLPKYKGDLLRIVKVEGDALISFLNDHKKGNIVRYKSYTSTSSSKYPQVEGNIYISIADAQGGVDVRDFNPTQKEILYKRDSYFYVNNIKKENGIYYVFVSEVKDGKK